MDYNNEKETKWVAQKILSYNDSETSLTLNVLLESGIFGENGFSTYYSPRLTFQIRDTRVSSTKLQFEFQFMEINSFVEKINKRFENGPAGAFRSSDDTITICRYHSGGRKDLIMSFIIIDRKPIIKIEIIDPSANAGIRNKVICIDHHTFVGIRSLFEQLRNNYASISVNALTFVLQSKILDQLKTASPNVVCSPVSIESVDTSSSPIENIEFKEEEKQPHSPQYDIQNEIMNTLDKAEIPRMDTTSYFDELEKKLESTKKEKKVYSEMPFIGTFCDFSPKRLLNYTNSLIHVDEKSVDSSFCPISNIIETVDPGNEEQLNDLHIYIGQLLQNVFIRTSINTFLKTGDFLVTPVFTFLNKITSKNEVMWKTANEILFCFIMLSDVYDSYMKYLQNNDKEENKKWSNGVLIAQNYIRLCYSTFFLSIRKDNNREIKETLIDIFNECKENGFLKELNDIYSKVSDGGSINLHQSIIEELFDKHISNLNSFKTFNGIDELRTYLTKINLDESEQINSKKDVKNLTIKCFSRNQKEEKEEVVQENNEDDKLTLFITCCGKHCEQSLKDKIMKECSDFEKLNTFLRENSVPDILIKIKRIMDLNEHFSKRSEIMNYLKTFKEPDEVTETRVFFEDTLDRDIENKKIKIQDFSNEKVINFGF